VDLRLPLSVVAKGDIVRLLRELEGLDNFFITARAPKSSKEPDGFELTQMLGQLAADNKIDLRAADQRKKLVASLKLLAGAAPILHISFAAEPSKEAIEKILGWLRTNIAPQTLITIGLQPAIAAGFILRTPNKIFDLSLRNHLKKQEPYLVKLIEQAIQ